VWGTWRCWGASGGASQQRRFHGECEATCGVCVGCVGVLGGGGGVGVLGGGGEVGVGHMATLGRFRRRIAAAAISR
jgi:hypothetical protein